MPDLTHGSTAPLWEAPRGFLLSIWRTIKGEDQMGMMFTIVIWGCGAMFAVLLAFVVPFALLLWWLL